MIKFYEYEEYDEQCGNCDYILKENEDLPEEGMSISGTYYVCPRCRKDWYENMKKINLKIIEMVKMTKKEYEELLNKST